MIAASALSGDRLIVATDGQISTLNAKTLQRIARFTARRSGDGCGDCVQSRRPHLRLRARRRHRPFRRHRDRQHRRSLGGQPRGSCKSRSRPMRGSSKAAATMGSASSGIPDRAAYRAAQGARERARHRRRLRPRRQDSLHGGSRRHRVPVGSHRAAPFRQGVQNGLSAAAWAGRDRPRRDTTCDLAGRLALCNATRRLLRRDLLDDEYATRRDATGLGTGGRRGLVFARNAGGQRSRWPGSAVGCSSAPRLVRRLVGLGSTTD